MYNAGPILALLAVVALVFVIQVSTRNSDRQRIREHIESRGGRLISIDTPSVFSGGSGGRNDRTYYVGYVTPQGQTIHAACKTSMGSGVYWINETPPGFPAELTVRGANSLDLVEEEPASPAEPIQCLGCGANIPESNVSCPQCGWSYKAHAGK